MGDLDPKNSWKTLIFEGKMHSKTLILLKIFACGAHLSIAKPFFFSRLRRAILFFRFTNSFLLVKRKLLFLRRSKHTFGGFINSFLFVKRSFSCLRRAKHILKSFIDSFLFVKRCFRACAGKTYLHFLSIVFYS